MATTSKRHGASRMRRSARNWRAMRERLRRFSGVTASSGKPDAPSLAGARFHFDEREHRAVVADQVDLTLDAGHREVARDDRVAVAAQIPVGERFAAHARARRRALARGRRALLGAARRDSLRSLFATPIRPSRRLRERTPHRHFSASVDLGARCACELSTGATFRGGFGERANGEIGLLLVDHQRRSKAQGVFSRAEDQKPLGERAATMASRMSGAGSLVF